MNVRIALVGVGKIARDQHLPAIAADPAFTLVATVDPKSGVDGVPRYPSLDALIADGPDVDAVVFCTPPRGREALAVRALRAGLHVMIEKPPAASLGDVDVMRAAAQASGRTLFAAWHSREAGAVGPARAWLVGRTITGVAIEWKEDIRRWHPGQDWILETGGFGVFDPGINALSIATAILPQPLAVSRATLEIPSNRQSPIAADVALTCGEATGRMVLDFLEVGEPCWTIRVDTDGGTLRISDGGHALSVAGQQRSFPNEEYQRLYERFAALIATAQSDVDADPFGLALDAFEIGTRRTVPAFEW